MKNLQFFSQESCNYIYGCILTVLNFVFGAYWYVFVAFFILNILDFVSGSYKARILKTESSETGQRGIKKKVGYWIAILVSFLISAVFTRIGDDLLHVNLSFLSLMGYYTLCCFIINEARSIIENLVEIGVDVPEVLVKGLAVTQKIIEKGEENNG